MLGRRNVMSIDCGNFTGKLLQRLPVIDIETVFVRLVDGFYQTLKLCH